MTVFFEIHHAPFEDGTPRHALISIELRGRALQLADDILREASHLCETDGVRDIHLICPLQENIRAGFADLMEELGIVGSIWVEYAFVTSRIKRSSGLKERVT